MVAQDFRLIIRPKIFITGRGNNNMTPLTNTIFRLSAGSRRFFAHLALLAGLLLFSGVLASTALAQSQSDLDRLKTLSGKDFEVDFLSMMIQHHQSALDMAKLVPDRANHQELKDTAQKIIADQTREINSMTSWLKSWYNTDPTSGMMHEGAGMGSDMMGLEGLKGDAFDKQFLLTMREHHMAAVEMARLVDTRADHAELKQLASNIITSQSAEIQQFEGWLKTWYNETVTGSTTGGDTSMPPDMMGGSSSSSGSSGGSSGSSSGATQMPPTGSQNAGPDMRIFILALLGIAGVIVAGGAWLRKRTS